MTRALGSRYRLGDAIGSGATGEVYAGADVDGQEFAFKVLRPELTADVDMVARFLQERAILTGLQHPNLVRVHDLVVEGDTAAIVMDLVRGGDLRAWLTRNGPLLPSEVARIGAAVARALAAVHAAQVVHRDVKPENILMDDSTASRTPRLTDFGISSLVGTSGTGAVAGTPQYLAPELVGGADPTAKSDLYSLGVVLYELACGVPPFSGDMDSVLRQSTEREPGRPEGVPDPLWDMTNWLLKRSPRARPQSAQRVAAVLDAMVAGLADQPAAPRRTAPPTAAAARPNLTTQARIPTSNPPRREQPRTASRPASSASAASSARRVTPPASRRRRGRKGKLILAVVVLLGIGGTAFVALRPQTHDAQAAEPPTASAGAPTTSAAAPTTTTAEVLSTAPDLIGKKVAEAQDMLPPSVQLDIVDAIQQGAEPDTVVSQDPKPGAALAGKLTITVARAAQQVGLGELTPVSGQWDGSGDPVSIAGKTYVHGVAARLGECARESSSVEYNLGKGFRRLTATGGIGDDAPSATTKAQLDIFGDDRKLTSVTIVFGKPAPIDVDVSGVLRLRFTLQQLSASGCTSGYLALGEPTLSGLPGEMPTSSAEPTG